MSKGKGSGAFKGHKGKSGGFAELPHGQQTRRPPPRESPRMRPPLILVPSRPRGRTYRCPTPIVRHCSSLLLTNMAMRAGR